LYKAFRGLSESPDLTPVYLSRDLKDLLSAKAGLAGTEKIVPVAHF
jgi:hypothetical protein